MPQICGCFALQQRKNLDLNHQIAIKYNQKSQQYNHTKNNKNIPQSIKKYFDFLEQIIQSGYKKTLKKRNINQNMKQQLGINQKFYKNFDQLPKQQQNYYLFSLMKQLKRRMLQNVNQKQNNNDQVFNFQMQKTLTIDTVSNRGGELLGYQNQQCIQLKCKFCSLEMLTLGLIKNWQLIILKFNRLKKRITIKYQNILFHIPLRSYTIQIDREQKILILDSIYQYQQKNLKKIMFKFKQKEKLELLYQRILQVIVAYQIDNILMNFKWNKNFEKIDDLRRNKNKLNLYLTEEKVKNCQQIIRKYENYEKIKNQRKNQKQILSKKFQNQEQIRISTFQNQLGQYYQGYININDSHQPTYINFLQIYQYSFKYLTKLTILQTMVDQEINQNFSSLKKNEKKYCALYQKLKIGQKIYGQQLFLQKQKNQEQNIQVFNFLNSDSEFNENLIDFMRIKLSKQKMDKEKSKNNNENNIIIIHILIKVENTNKLSNKRQDQILFFISQFYHMFQRLRIRLNNNNQQNQQSLNLNNTQRRIIQNQINYKFYLNKDLISRFQQEGQISYQASNRIKNEIQSTSNSYIMKRNAVQNVPYNAYLRRHHQLTPTDQKIGRIMKEHFLYKQWQRLPEGGLKSFQKSLYKTVLKKFGQNILKGRNIINFSLPVVCFKKQSHLQSLASSMCYCPIYLQRAAKIKNPFERMKYSVVIMIATGILTVLSEKPFNPILGQTYQGYVDGCPVYLEQISHHPPISAYYMIGRGYKMYGCVEPRITLGLNGATGYSILPHYIEFDDGTKIQVIFAKITIGGMLIGDRQFYFEDKIYAFDQKNNFFTQLIFGPIKNGFFTSSSEPLDYFHGKIYQVTQKFKQKFLKSTPRIYPTQQDIIRQNLMFDGIWSGSIYMDGEQIINFKTDLPYQFVEQQYPIASDSRYRKDLQTLRAGDKQEAQRFKQQMEDQQRRDKKLRQNGGKFS